MTHSGVTVDIRIQSIYSLLLHRYWYSVTSLVVKYIKLHLRGCLRGSHISCFITIPKIMILGIVISH